MKKKVVATILAMVCAVSLLGCGGTTDSGNTTAQGTETGAAVDKSSDDATVMLRKQLSIGLIVWKKSVEEQ